MDNEQDTRVFIADILRDVCELPDRTSPYDDPDMLMVTYDELKSILEDNFGLNQPKEKVHN